MTVKKSGIINLFFSGEPTYTNSIIIRVKLVHSKSWYFPNIDASYFLIIFSRLIPVRLFALFFAYFGAFLGIC